MSVLIAASLIRLDIPTGFFLFNMIDSIFVILFKNDLLEIFLGFYPVRPSINSSLLSFACWRWDKRRPEEEKIAGRNAAGGIHSA